MSEPRIIFMGTPVFACGILQRLIDEGCNIVGVVSQPDKKVGRKQELQPTPIKQLDDSMFMTPYGRVCAAGSRLILQSFMGKLKPAYHS